MTTNADDLVQRPAHELDNAPKALLRELRGPELREAAIRWRAERNIARSELRTKTQRVLRLERELVDARDACKRYSETVRANDAEIERLRAEVDRLTDDAMEPRLRSMNATGNGIQMDLEGGACRIMAEWLASQYLQENGVNYIECRFTSHEAMPGESFLVTVQRVNGKTPHQLRQDAERQLAELRENTEAAQVKCLVDIRWAVGDKGKLMQDELVEHIKGIVAERDSLRESIAKAPVLEGRMTYQYADEVVSLVGELIDGGKRVRLLVEPT